MTCHSALRGTYPARRRESDSARTPSRSACRRMRGGHSDDRAEPAYRTPQRPSASKDRPQDAERGTCTAGVAKPERGDRREAQLPKCASVRHGPRCERSPLSHSGGELPQRSEEFAGGAATCGEPKEILKCAITATGDHAHRRPRSNAGLGPFQGVILPEAPTEERANLRVFRAKPDRADECSYVIMSAECTPGRAMKNAEPVSSGSHAVDLLAVGNPQIRGCGCTKHRAPPRSNACRASSTPWKGCARWNIGWVEGMRRKLVGPA